MLSVHIEQRELLGGWQCCCLPVKLGCTCNQYGCGHGTLVNVMQRSADLERKVGVFESLGVLGSAVRHCCECWGLHLLLHCLSGAAGDVLGECHRCVGGAGLSRAPGNNQSLSAECSWVEMS